MIKIKFKGTSISVTESLTSLRMKKNKRCKEMSPALTRFGIQMAGLW